MTSPPAVRESTLTALIRASDELWEAFRAEASDRFHLVIPCDLRDAHTTLRRLRSRATSFLELGSATGAVTILADLLGYEACGIEIEPWLVARSQDLAARFASGATLVEGSFVPPEYQDDVETLSSEFFTPTHGACAYDELSLELDDFDLVYAYPWPGEEEWLLEMIRRHARPDALLLTYDVAEGFRVFHADGGLEDPADELGPTLLG